MSTKSKMIINKNTRNLRNLWLRLMFEMFLPFLNKQTQFPPASNDHNFLFDKVLRQFLPLRTPQKQTQFKPNQTQSPKCQNEPKFR